MKLELENGTVIENPGDDEIASALASVDRGDGLFVILGQTDLTYIQAFRDNKLGLVLEYQDGSLSEHFRSTDLMVALDRATRTFQRYATGNKSWHGEIRWRKVPLRELSTPGVSAGAIQSGSAQQGGDSVERLSAPKASKTIAAGEPYAWEKQHRRREAWRDAAPETSKGLEVPWYYVVAAISVMLFVLLPLREALKGPASTSSAQRDPNTLTLSNNNRDEAAMLIARCGKPSLDDDNQTEDPRPILPARSLDYQQYNLSIMFLPAGDTPVGSPPPYRWNLFGIIDMATGKKVEPRDAIARMPCLARE